MELLLVRHGQTQANAEKRYLGALDLGLNSHGIKQAQDLAKSLALEPQKIQALYSSPLLRARQTADLVAQALGLSVEVEQGLRERNVGVFEGLTQGEAQQRFADLWRRNITRQWHGAPTGGETIAQVFARVAGVLHALCARHADGEGAVLLVAHGFVAKAVRALQRDCVDDFFEWQLGNGECLRLSLDRARDYGLSASRLMAGPAA